MSDNILLTDIRYIKGVGPKRVIEFNRLGVRNLIDLFYFFPRRYEDRSNIKLISDLESGEIVTVFGSITAANIRRSLKNNRPIFQAVIDDGSSCLKLNWFNQPYLRNVIKKGIRIIAYGKIDYYKGLCMNSPYYEVIDKEDPELGIVPVYPLAGGLSQKFIRKLIRSEFMNNKNRITELMPDWIMSKHVFIDRVSAIANIHFPENEDIIGKSRRYLAYEEMFLLQIAIGLRRIKRNISSKTISYNPGRNLSVLFKEFLPFDLTPEQDRVLSQVEKDMLSSQPMSRLVQGEVGSGKTVIASYAALLAAKSGYQSAIMVPTEVLAQQQYLKIAEIMCNFDVDVGILTGDMDRSGQKEIKNSILAGSIKVVIGTHALLEENIKFKNLGIVIIDEQHKFGVKQRDSLKQKGKVPDYLIMTATPIPRTLALTIFGDMDISTIKETPFGPKSINTYWVTEERRSQVYRFLKESVDNGAQGFVVCPRIEDNSDSEIKNVQRLYFEAAGLLGENKVALLHGRMSSEQKKNILSDFKKGKVSVLVSTVVIEVGIDVPDASIMIIEDASRFGLSQLHQLRGRVGRAGQESFCILISDPSNKDAVMRLESMVSSLDGFKISEDDLQIRGAGELMGLKQHGFYGMRLQNIVRQVDLLSDARQDAFSILNHDPHLSSESNKAIKLEIKSRFPVLSGIK